MRSNFRAVRQGITLRNAAAPASAARCDVARSSDVSRRPIVATRVATRPGSSTTLRDEASAAAAALERSLALPSEVKEMLNAETEEDDVAAFGSSTSSSVAPSASTSSSSTATSSSPTTTVSLADRKNPGASADELTSTWEHRAWVAGTSALLLALAAQGVDKCLHAEGGGGFASVAAALGASYLLSDFLTAVYHWSVDNYGDGSTPIVGGQIAAFQGHHQVN